MPLKFKDFVHNLEEAARKTDVVKTLKMGKVTAEIVKRKNEFVVYIDGDELDSYKSQKEAETMAKEFAKQYKR